jgi:hypothetical protein
MLPSRRRLEPQPEPGKDGSGAPDAGAAVPDTARRPGGPGQALPLGLDHHLPLPFTGVQAGEVLIRADHAPTFGSPVTRESSGQVTFYDLSLRNQGEFDPRYGLAFRRLRQAEN